MVTTIAASISSCGFYCYIGLWKGCFDLERGEERAFQVRMGGWKRDKHVCAWYETGLAEICAALKEGAEIIDRCYQENFGITLERKF